MWAKLILAMPFILKTLGQVLMSIVATLLTGKTFKSIVLWPFQWIASRTKNKKDDELVHRAEEDLGLQEGDK
jgi:hypothetical protein